MGDQQAGASQFGPGRQQPVLHAGTGEGIERAERLIKDQQIAGRQYRTGQRHPLTHPT